MIFGGQGVTLFISDSDKEVTEVHVSKAQKIERKSGRPKARDFKEADKELVLMAANIYRVLLASQDAFPNASTEMTLVKKAWKQMNAESGLKARTITPSMVSIVSFYIYILIYYVIIIVSR